MVKKQNRTDSREQFLCGVQHLSSTSEEGYQGQNPCDEWKSLNCAGGSIAGQDQTKSG